MGHLPTPAPPGSPPFPQPGRTAGIQCYRRRPPSRRPRPAERGKDLPPGCPRPRPGGQVGLDLKMLG